MPRVMQTTIRCPSCGQPFNAAVENMIDAAQDPEGKLRLLSGQLNAAQCPHCGNVFALAAPLLYHDPSKELLVAYVPMELNLPKDDQEKLIGDMMRQLTASLPKDAFRGYMFNPRRALTMQGLVEQVLEADGITPEVMQQQRDRIALAQSFVEAPDDDLPALIQHHDADIDAQFFQTFSIMAQRLLAEGRDDLAERVLVTQQRVAELSTYGQELLAQQAAHEEVVREVAETLQALGEDAQRSDFLDLVLRYAEDDQRLQALVGLARPVFDYLFFQDFTDYIGQAPTAERDQLEALRDRLVALTTLIDQQTQLRLRQAAGLLQALLTSPNPDELIHANLALIDDTFMAVLATNIKEAEKQKNISATARLKELYNRVVNVLQENMQPELRFINELLGAETEDDVRHMIAERGKDYGPQLLMIIDGVKDMLAGQGDADMLSRLEFLRQEAAEVLR